MSFLVNFINRIKTVPEESLNKLLPLFEYKLMTKGERIAEIGEIPTDLVIIETGVIRSFYTDEKGKEYINHLFTPYNASGSLAALILDKPSRLTYECLSNCKLYTLNFKDFKELTITDTELSNLYVAFLELVFLILELKIFDLSVLNATERYLKIKEQIPNIENLIPQYHIASYLNITPVQLSRIRKTIYSK